jgi:hypothetical protein
VRHHRLLAVAALVALGTGGGSARCATEPAKVEELAALMGRYMADGRSTPVPKQKDDVDVVWDRRRK